MKTVYSIGHSNHTISQFCNLLHDHKIDYLIDIRSVPFSRYYPQFNQKPFMEVMEKENIQYIFLGNELGGRIKDTTCYKNHTIPTIKNGYAMFLNYDVIKTKEWFTLGIQKIYSLVENGICAIMCSEENPEKCHRELIVGRKLKEDGYSLIHIRTNKGITPQLALFE